MKRKSIIALTLAAMMIVPLISGCGNSNNTANNTAKDGNTTTVGDSDNTDDKDKDSVKDEAEKGMEDVKNSVENGAEDVKNEAKRIGDDIKYTAINFKDDIVKAGYDVKDSLDTHKDYFKGTETDYLVGDDLVRIYEYDTPEALDADIATISGGGTTINGTVIDFANTPTYYRSGDTLIVYEGDDDAYIKELNTLYGTAIVPAA